MLIKILADLKNVKIDHSKSFELPRSKGLGFPGGLLTLTGALLINADKYRVKMDGIA